MRVLLIKDWKLCKFISCCIRSWRKTAKIKAKMYVSSSSDIIWPETNQPQTRAKWRSLLSHVWCFFTAILIWRIWKGYHWSSDWSSPPFLHSLMVSVIHCTGYVMLAFCQLMYNVIKCLLKLFNSSISVREYVFFVFFTFQKTWLFTFFFKWLWKKRKKSVAKILSSMMLT